MDAKQRLRKIIKEEVRRQLIAESLGTWKAAGIPDELSKYVLKNFRFNQSDPFETISTVPKSSEFERGRIIINIIDSNNAIAIAKVKEKGGFVRFDLSNGKVTTSYPSSLRKAISGMTQKGKFVQSQSYNILYDPYESPGRKSKPSPEDISARSTSDPLAGSINNIYAYMNKTFMPGIRTKLEGYVDNIYANLRKISNNRTWLRLPTDQESALDAVRSLEKIAKNGFTTDSMKTFLDSLNNPNLQSFHGAGEIPINSERLEKALKTVPNARAKWAKTILDTAKEYNDYVMDLVQKSQK